MVKESILFIVNPVSGTGKQKQLNSVLKAHLDLEKFDYHISFTEYGGHATEIAKNAVANFDIVIAVGGDGTVNEVAKGLTGSNCIMGIIPVGSGNGLARHLKLSMRLAESIKIINRKQVKTIDAATINDNYFVNVAGIGFDAHVAHLYAKTSTRGPIPYAKIMTNEFYKYKPVDYKILIDDKQIESAAFLISFANSSQFGNNAYISPNAIIDDGLIDVCIMREFPIVEVGQITYQLFNKRVDRSKYMKIIKASSVKVIASQEMKGHIDGEPVDFSSEIEVVVKPMALNIIYNTEESKFKLPAINWPKLQ